MKKKIWFAAGICLILAGLICAGVAIGRYRAEADAGKIYEDLKEELNVPTPESVTVEESVQASESLSEELSEDSMEESMEDSIEESVEEVKEPVEIPIDFATLTEQYPDIYAWIQIPGTDIDYPIVQREGDNAYYLNHTIDGKKKKEGAIFTEDYNTKDFTDPNTLIYGHNMKNGSMFRGLHKFKDKKFMEENTEIIIYMPDKILRYQIFAAYVNDSRHLLFLYDFDDPEVFESYIDEVLDRKSMSSNIDNTVEVTAEDKIITLSTCNGNDDQRYLVQAVLLSIEE